MADLCYKCFEVLALDQEAYCENCIDGRRAKPVHLQSLEELLASDAVPGQAMYEKKTSPMEYWAHGDSASVRFRRTPHRRLEGHGPDDAANGPD